MGARLLIAAVRVYRWIISPAMRFLFGTSGACRYTPSCSCYAIEAFERHGGFGGLRLTISRLLRCHPWGSAGDDPVPHNLNLTRNPNLLSRLGVRSGLRSGTKGKER
jgi:putative membrane protein insertion efficiency factor